MTLRSRLVSRPAVLLFGAWITIGIGCGSSGSSAASGGSASGTVGASGGTVSLAGGPTLQVPAGALGSSTSIAIQDTGQTAPSGGPIYQFTPVGTTFSQPATVQIPVPAGVTNPRIYWTAAGGSTQFDALATTVTGSTASAQVTHFSLGYVAPAPAVATPTFSPPAGSYTAAQTVTVASTTPGAVIYYTVDGSTPTASSTTYTAPVSVAASLTLKAIASATGYTASAVATAAYVINTGGAPQAATPTFTPGAGSYTAAQTVTVASTTPGAVIYYTVDGSTPTTSSTTYTAPVSVTASLTLKAIATATGYTTSAVGTATYVIGGGTPPTSLTLCQYVFDRYISLIATCMHANPDYLNSINPLLQNTCTELEKAVELRHVVYDNIQGVPCQAAVDALTCQDFALGTTPPSCKAAWKGTAVNGGTCENDVDCGPGTCNSTASVCPGICVAYATVGQTCITSADCSPELTCDAGTCKTPSGVGGACPCQGDLWCDVGTAKCAAPLASGATCTSSGQCGVFAECVGTPTTTCQGFVGLGATCSGTAGPPCGLGYNCASGACVSYPKVGDPCGVSTPVCIGGYCNALSFPPPASPTCVAYKAVGAACLSGLECATGACTTGFCALNYCPER
jgi:hypothetical protein